MKTATAAITNPISGRRFKDDLFSLSIRRIVSDVLLHEIKSNSEIRAIAIVSAFREDGRSEITEQVSHAFSVQGSKTLLLNLQNSQFAGAFLIDPLKSGKLMEDCIVKKDKSYYDTLNLSDIGKICGFTLDKASLANLLYQLKSKYRRIIINTEPLDEGMSGFMAASAADGVYFICNHSNMRTRQPERDYRKLKGIGVSILGIIYNNVDLNMMKKINSKKKK